MKSSPPLGPVSTNRLDYRFVAGWLEQQVQYRVEVR
jgi:hypothetical protein